MTSMMKDVIYAHIFKDNKLLTKTIMYFVPRVGDEIRLSVDKYHTVKRIIWVFDEPASNYSRLNMEIEDIKDET